VPAALSRKGTDATMQSASGSAFVANLVWDYAAAADAGVEGWAAYAQPGPSLDWLS
jgi:hypothetical protein